jgi:Mce-associated membrane protein
MLAVAGAAALGWLSWAGVDGVDDVRSADRVATASDSAAAAAERAAAAILVYDHRRLEEDRDAAAEFMTGDMAERYTKTFDSVVAPAAEQTRAQVTVEVQGSSVVRGSEEQVRVLLFVDQSTTSTANPTPKLALNRVEMVMVREDGSWWVDEITSY